VDEGTISIHKKVKKKKKKEDGKMYKKKKKKPSTQKHREQLPLKTNGGC